MFRRLQTAIRRKAHSLVVVSCIEGVNKALRLVRVAVLAKGVPGVRLRLEYGVSVVDPWRALVLVVVLGRLIGRLARSGREAEPLAGEVDLIARFSHWFASRIRSK